MAATTGATGTSSLTGAWLTNAQSDAVIGYPSNPEWPGPVNENHEDAGPADPGRSGPPQGTAAPAIPAVPAPPYADLGGGQVTDTQADTFGYSAPLGPTFSQTEPFKPPGPIADTHSIDTGGVGRKDHVDQPRSPGWFRRILTGQTFNRQAQVTDNAGWRVNSINGRTDLDQYQGQNADAYNPFWIPYSERPIRANFAHEAYPVDGNLNSPYGLDGNLADMAGLGGQGNYGYTTPPDPVIITDPAVQAGQQVQASAATGLEFLNYG